MCHLHIFKVNFKFSINSYKFKSQVYESSLQTLFESV